MKLMKHEQHGFHHAMSPAEEAAMRSNGWTAEADEPPLTEGAPIKANPDGKKKPK